MAVVNVAAVTVTNGRNIASELGEIASIIFIGKIQFFNANMTITEGTAVKAMQKKLYSSLDAWNGNEIRATVTKT
jgi:hypothetical protein